MRANTLESLTKFIVPEPNSGCWLWSGGVNGHGYGTATIRRKPIYAHVAIYSLYKGPISEGMELDHKCRVRCCVNPDHLEPVTHQENVLRGISLLAQNARKTHCPKGHKYDLAIPRANGKLSRYCSLCANENNRLYRLRKKLQCL